MKCIKFTLSLPLLPSSSSSSSSSVSPNQLGHFLDKPKGLGTGQRSPPLPLKRTFSKTSIYAADFFPRRCPRCKNAYVTTG